MSTRARSWAGSSRATCVRTWLWTRWRWRSGSATPPWTGSCITATGAGKPCSTGRRNTLIEGWTMAYGSRQLQVRAYRGQIPSPGRPSVALREDRVRFWAAIATGALTDEAAVAAGVSSPVGYRWFRHAGGVNPQLPPTVSGRYLSFSEREDIALLKAQGDGVRKIARRVGRHPSTVSRELRRNASTRTWRLDYKPSIA